MLDKICGLAYLLPQGVSGVLIKKAVRKLAVKYFLSRLILLTSKYTPNSFAAEIKMSFSFSLPAYCVFKLAASHQ
jgi:hypothetical protein